MAYILNISLTKISQKNNAYMFSVNETMSCLKCHASPGDYMVGKPRPYFQ